MLYFIVIGQRAGGMTIQINKNLELFVQKLQKFYRFNFRTRANKFPIYFIEGDMLPETVLLNLK